MGILRKKSVAVIDNAVAIDMGGIMEFGRIWLSNMCFIERMRGGGGAGML